jgi:hypothetical protein
MGEWVCKLFSQCKDVSIMRWVFFWTFLIVVDVPLFSWAIAYHSDHKADIPAGVVTFCTLILATVTTGKAYQFAKENPNVQPQKLVDPGPDPGSGYPGVPLDDKRR